jgi:RHS repeat-associated protein
LMVEDVLSTDNRNLDEGVLLFRYQYSNHLGSVGLEVDDDGNIIFYEEYHPYGTTAFSASGSGVRATRKRYRYTGMERDEESGLSYHSARYYLPWLGRWGGVDPAGLAGGENLFMYTTGNRKSASSEGWRTVLKYM